MQRWLHIVALMVAYSCLYSPAVQAQTTRPLIIELDTVRFNVCDGVKTFLLPVSIGDISVADSLAAVQIYLAWDKENLDIEDQAITSSETIGVQFSEKQVVRNRDEGSLIVVLANTDVNSAVAGTGKPLFFIKGKVTSTDVVGGNRGWVLVLSATFESKTRFEPVDKSRSGQVIVTRDTTAAYTGTMSVDAASMGSAQTDTVSLTVGNLGNRRVNRIEFSLKNDPRYFGIVDTVQTGTLASSVNWTTKSILITPDSISGVLESQVDLTASGALLKVVLHRNTDSAFQSMLTVDRFLVNGTSCLGKLTRSNGSVSALNVKDSSVGGVEDQRRAFADAIRVIPELRTGSLRIVVGTEHIEEVVIFDVTGRRLPTERFEQIDASTLRVRLTPVPTSGNYFVGLRGRNEIVYKQFSIKK